MSVEPGPGPGAGPSRQPRSFRRGEVPGTVRAIVAALVVIGGMISATAAILVPLALTGMFDGRKLAWTGAAVLIAGVVAWALAGAIWWGQRWAWWATLGGTVALAWPVTLLLAVDFAPLRVAAAVLGGAIAVIHAVAWRGTTRRWFRRERWDQP